jgi:hypothetical protein
VRFKRWEVGIFKKKIIFGLINLFLDGKDPVFHSAGW